MDISQNVQEATWISSIRRIILAVAVEVDAARVANGVARQEPPRARVVEAVRTQEQACLRVRVVPRLPLVPPRVRLACRAGARPIAVVQVAGLHGCAAVEPLGHVSPFIEGVEGSGTAADIAPGDQPICPRCVGGRQRPRAAVLAHGLATVIQEVCPANAALFPRPQAVRRVAVRLSGSGVVCQPVLGVKREGAGFVGGRIAVAVVAVARVRHLVVRVEGVRRPLEGGRVAGAGAGPPVVAEGVGVAAAPRAGFLRHLAAPGRGRGRAVVVGIGSRSAVGGGGVAHRGRDGQPVARPVVAARRGHGEVGEDRAPARLVHLVAQAALILSTP